MAYKAINKPVAMLHTVRSNSRFRVSFVFIL